MKKLWLSTSLLFLLVISGCSQQKESFTVGVIAFGNTQNDTLLGFQDGLSLQGFRQDINLTYLHNEIISDKSRLKDIVAKVVSAGPDLIFAAPTPSARAVKEATRGTGIPVIFAPVNDPVSAGVVTQISRPEANLTGVRLAASDGKRLATLLSIVPTIQRILVPYNPTDRSALSSLEQIASTAKDRGLTILKRDFRKNDDIYRPGFLPIKFDAIFLPRDAEAMSRLPLWLNLSHEKGVPVSSVRTEQVKEGALSGYGFIGYEIGKQAAAMAVKVLNGVPIAEIPVETANDFLSINLETAQSLGIVISKSRSKYKAR